MQGEQDKVRLDKWLWAARFYKTRSMASDAVNGGHVRVNEQRVKAARQISIGDMLSINKVPYTYNITVLALTEKRVAAKIAQTFYAESAESIAAREVQQQQRAILAQTHRPPLRRPDKRSRRDLMRLRDKV